MREDIAARIEPKKNEQQQAREDAARDIAGGLGIFAPKSSGVDAEDPESAHHHSGSADAEVWVWVEPQAGKISGGAGQKGEQKGQTRAETGHRESEHQHPEGH